VTGAEPPAREVLADLTWDWTLFRAPDGSLLLSVVCGSVGLYEVEVTLDDVQAADYERNGRQSIESLAAAVREHPAKFVRPQA